MYICVCAAVTDSQVHKQVINGASMKDLRKTLCVAGQCCKCVEELRQILLSHNKYLDGTSADS